jgi:hypothetical protein
MNYIEFLRKLEMMLRGRADVLSVKVKCIVGKNMRCRLHKLSRVNNRINIYGLLKWEEFICRANFNSYLTAISELSQKNNDSIDVSSVPADKRFASTLATKNE